MITGSKVPQLHYRKYVVHYLVTTEQLHHSVFKGKVAWDFFMFREGEYAKIICRILLYGDRLKHELSWPIFN
jgi:hypothetical protein